MTSYTHPSPTKYRLQQIAGLIVILLVIVAIPVQLLLATQLSAFLFLISIPPLILLLAPLTLVLSATPPVSIDDDGIMVQPFIGRDWYIAWEDVLAFKDYPLLPHAAGEHDRRLVVGKKNYQAARGKMLVLHDASLPYRVVGFFAGERSHGVVAVTSRSHTNYDTLVKTLEKRLKRHR